MSKPGAPPDAERRRQAALSRWENEGGAEPCGPQVPGAAKACVEQPLERKRAQEND